MRLTPLIREWGSTPGERALALPCDALAGPGDDALWRAVGIDAPAPLVFRWVCQLRAAPYSYDNLGRRSPQELTPGLDDLAPGQRFMYVFTLAAHEPGRSITLCSASALFGRVLTTYAVLPVDDGPTRLVVKPRLGPAGGLQARALRAVLPAGDLVMMRRQLLNLKALAERDAARAPARYLP